MHVPHKATREDDLKKLRRSAQPCIWASKSSVNTRPSAIIRGLWIRNYRCRSERKQGRNIQPAFISALEMDILAPWWELRHEWLYAESFLWGNPLQPKLETKEYWRKSRVPGEPAAFSSLTFWSNGSLPRCSQSQSKLAGTKGTGTEIRYRGFIRLQSRWLRWHVVRAFYWNLGMFSPGLLCL